MQSEYLQEYPRSYIIRQPEEQSLFCHIGNKDFEFFSFVSCCVSDQFVIIPLHSLMPTVNQTQVSTLLFFTVCLSLLLCLSVCLFVFPFQYQKSNLILVSHFSQVFKRPPPGVRKIVIATNIAETRYGGVFVWVVQLLYFYPL